MTSVTKQPIRIVAPYHTQAVSRGACAYTYVAVSNAYLHQKTVGGVLRPPNNYPQIITYTHHCVKIIFMMLACSQD